MSEIRSIKAEALSLSVGETTNMYCPICDNDKPYPKSMSITRTDDGILYNCYRSSCSGSGFIGSLPNHLMSRKEKKFKSNEFVSETRQPTKELIDYLGERYALTQGEITMYGIKEISEPRGILIPCKTSSGNVWCTTQKLFGQRAKAKHFIEKEVESKLAWFKGTGSTIVLTEDVISAIRCRRFGSGSAALLGTRIDSYMVNDLFNEGITKIILALDPDALDKALFLKSKWSLFFDQFVVASLSKDPKDLSHLALRKELFGDD